MDCALLGRGKRSTVIQAAKVLFLKYSTRNVVGYRVGLSWHLLSLRMRCSDYME